MRLRRAAPTARGCSTTSRSIAFVDRDHGTHDTYYHSNGPARACAPLGDEGFRNAEVLCLESPAVYLHFNRFAFLAGVLYERAVNPAKSPVVPADACCEGLEAVRPPNSFVLGAPKWDHTPGLVACHAPTGHVFHQRTE